jgi:hypothetical protein
MVLPRNLEILPEYFEQGSCSANSLLLILAACYCPCYLGVLFYIINETAQDGDILCCISHAGAPIDHYECILVYFFW